MLRQRVHKAITVAKELKITKARELKTKGRSNADIAKQLGLSESTVRMILKSDR